MPQTTNAIIGTDIMRAIGSLCERAVILVPTETDYVLACNALDPEAVQRLLSFDTESGNAHVELLVPSMEKVTLYAKEFPHTLETLAGSFPPGRLTFLLPKKYVVSDRLTAGTDKAAISVSQHPLTTAVLERVGFPLAVVRVSMTRTAEDDGPDFLALQGHRIGYVLDGGATVVGPGSTWVEMGDGCILVHRTGSVTREDVERVAGLPTLQHLAPMTPADSPSRAGISRPV